MYMIRKMKIPMPLLKVQKLPLHRKYLINFIDIKETKIKTTGMISTSPSKTHPYEKNEIIFKGNLPIQSDEINLYDEKPFIIVGTLLNTKGHVSPPFFNNSSIKGLHVHNFLYDYRSSISLMPLSMVKNQGLNLTKCYTYVYSFD